MFSKVLIIAGIATAVSSQSFDVNVNRTRVNEILQQWKSLEGTNMKAERKADEDLKETVGGIFAKIQTDVVYNYGRIASPIVDKYAMIFKKFQWNASCKQDCVVEECFEESNFSIDYTCGWNKCGCSLVDPAGLKKAERDYMVAVDNAHNNVMKPWIKENGKQIMSALKTWDQAKAQATQRAVDLIKEQLRTNHSACNQSCFNNCENYYRSNFFGYMACSKRCMCNSNTVIQITPNNQ
jgi:hypothetical protein